MRSMGRVLILLILPAAAVAAENWPQFRGPGGQGVSDAVGVPVEWNRTKNIVWRQPLPGNGWSSPVLQDGRIWLTTAVAADEGPVSLRVLCVDADTGTILWNTEIAQQDPHITIHPKNSHASATPVVNGGRVYVHFASSATAAVDSDNGRIVWKTQIDYEPRHGTGSSPVLFDDLLIVNCDGEQTPFVTALDAASGQERWRTYRPDIAGKPFSFSTPLLIEVNGAPQLVSPASDLVAGYDPADGRQLWIVRYPERWSVVPRPVFADGLVLVCTGYVGPAELLAIRPDGSGDVTDTHVVWRTRRFVPHNPSPVVSDGNVFLVSDRGIASCRDLQTGTLHWKMRLKGNYSASPLLAEGRVYFLSESGLCTVVRAAAEPEILARNDLQERTLASPVPADGTLFLRSAEALYRIGHPTTGSTSRRTP